MGLGGLRPWCRCHAERALGFEPGIEPGILPALRDLTQRPDPVPVQSIPAIHHCVAYPSISDRFRLQLLQAVSKLLPEGRARAPVWEAAVQGAIGRADQ